MVNSQQTRGLTWGHLLGDEGGGTKAVCSLANSEQKVLNKSYSGPSNYHKSGVYSAKTSIQGMAVDSAMKMLRHSVHWS
jgi:N-acetylglucosamine kinase